MSIKIIIFEVFVLAFGIFTFKLALAVSLMIAELIAAWSRIKQLKPIILGILITLITPVILSSVFKFCKVDNIVYETIRREIEKRKYMQTVYQKQEIGVGMVSSDKNTAAAELQVAEKARADAENAKKIAEAQVADLQKKLETAQQQLAIEQEARYKLNEQILDLKSPKKKDKPAPTADKPAPAADKPAPAADKPAPTADKPAPTADKPAPAAGKPAPATQKKQGTIKKKFLTTINRRKKANLATK